jgi:uncharacterized membrane protein YhaH (DUF805 family)
MRATLRPHQDILSGAPELYQNILSFSGRVNRAMYWLYLAIAAPMLALLHGVYTFALSQGDGGAPLYIGLLDAVIEIVTMFLILAILLAGAAMTVRRLHDRNKTGSWIAHFVIAPALFFWLGQAFLDAHFEPVHSLPFLLQFVALFVLAWAFAELCCRRGTSGDNRFGSDPLSSKSDAQGRIPKSLAP